MMYGMKGEWPEDVKKPEEVEAEKEKKPFYKQGKWWLLAALATLMAVATGYGMWLGSQYVKAVENAAHIIADANTVVAEESVSLKKNRLNGYYYPDSGNYFDFDLSGLSAPSGYIFYDLRTGVGTSDFGAVPDNTGLVQFFHPSADIYLASFSKKEDGVRYDYRGADVTHHIIEFDCDQIDLNEFYPYPNDNQRWFEISSFPVSMSGRFIFNDAFYNGYNQGYEDGFQNGLDTDDVDQEVRIVYNTAIGSYARYEVYIDGATTASYSGRVGSDQHEEAFVTLNRPAGEVWKIVITANSAFHLAYTSSLRHLPPRWPLLTPQLEDNGVYAFPTTWSQVGFYIADQVDDANAAESWELRLDPSINQAAIGTYGRGYADGYEDGKQDGDAEGYERGFAEGEDTAQEAAYNRGLNDGNGFGKSLSAMFVVAFQQPFDVMYRYLNFNFLGINFLAIFAGMLTLGLGIYVIKKVM